MKTLSGREFARVIKRHGWRLLRINGSHHVYGKDDSPVRLSIPIHGSKPLKLGLMRKLMKVANISENELD